MLLAVQLGADFISTENKEAWAGNRQWLMGTGGAGFPQVNNYIRKDLVESMQALGPTRVLKEKENLVLEILATCLSAEKAHRANDV